MLVKYVESIHAVEPVTEPSAELIVPQPTSARPAQLQLLLGKMIASRLYCVKLTSASAAFIAAVFIDEYWSQV